MRVDDELEFADFDQTGFRLGEWLKRIFLLRLLLLRLFGLVMVKQQFVFVGV